MKRGKDKSPRFGKLLLRLFLDQEEFYQISGDLEEVFLYKRETLGYPKTLLWYGKQIVKSLPSFFSSFFYWRLVMAYNYLRIAIRNIRKNKIYSVINITGLSIGLFICMLTIPYIRFELSYDQFHHNIDNIYRIQAHSLGRNIKFASTPARLAQTLKEEFPEVRFAARVKSDRGYFKYKKKRLSETKFYLADPDFFKIFTFPIIAGDKSALNEPFSIFISQKLADNYFKGGNPIGKTLNYNDSYQFTIRGVLADIPENSYLKFDLLTSTTTLKTLIGEKYLTRWYSHDFYTFVLLNHKAGHHSFQKKLSQLIRPVDMNKKDKRDVFYSQTMRGLYNSTELRGEIEETNDIRYIYMLSIITIIILLIACLNYMTLATARDSRRVREIGIRKVVGAGRQSLINQFLGESIFFSVFAFFLSLIMVGLFQPLFNSFIKKDLYLSLFGDLPIFFLVSVLVGGLAGLYPALFLSSFQPIKIFRGILRRESKPSQLLRKSLVLVQFVITTVLISCTFIVHNQLKFMLTESMSHLDNPVLTVRVNEPELRKNHKKLLNAFNQSPRIWASTASYNNPLWISWGTGMSWQGKEGSQLIRLDHVDFNYIDFYGIKLKKGRMLSQHMSTDKREAVLINETAARDCPWKDPIGKHCKTGGVEGVVVGIVKDFHFKSLDVAIEPLAFRHILDEGFWSGVNYISLKLEPTDITGTLKFLETTWSKFSAYYPFDYTFQDQAIQNMYRVEKHLSQSYIYLTSIAIFLAIIGLLGLTSFTIERRTKEIGIRKVLGASLQAILLLLTRDTFKWIILAFTIAFPIAYFIMKEWLQKFAYRVDLRLETFILAAGISLLITLLAMAYQSIRAALTNPVDTLNVE